MVKSTSVNPSGLSSMYLSNIFWVPDLYKNDSFSNYCNSIIIISVWSAFLFCSFTDFISKNVNDQGLFEEVYKLNKLPHIRLN